MMALSVRAVPTENRTQHKNEEGGRRAEVCARRAQTKDEVREFHLNLRRMTTRKGEKNGSGNKENGSHIGTEVQRARAGH